MKQNTFWSWQASYRLMIGLGIASIILGALVSLRQLGLEEEWQARAGEQWQTTQQIPVKLSWQDSGVYLEPTKLAYGVWPLSENNGHYLLNSASLDQPGNVIMYGHNYEEVMGWLVDVEIGDELQVVDNDGQEYSYQVVEVKDVTADDISLLEDTDESVLTVYTCSGWFDQYRRVVRGVRI